VDVPSEVPSISNINWKGAKIVVLIPDYGIQDTMDIYPVPYALFTANRDDAITTEEIVKYLKKIDTSDFEKIITAFYGNPSTNPTLEKYVVDTVLNYIKANKTAVRNMLLNWLGQMDESDLDTAYKMVTSNTDIVNFINKHAVQYAKDHKSDAKEIALYYVQTTTRGEVKSVLDAVNGNSAFDTVATIIADTVVKYIENHPAKVREVAQYYIDQANASDVDNVKAYALEHNETVYNYVKRQVDSMIQLYLDSNAYINNYDCQQYDICSLLEAIQTLENSEFVPCPELGQIDTVRFNNANNVTVTTPNAYITSFVLRDTIKNNTFDVNLQNLGKDSLIYVVSYPNTIYPNDTLQASLLITPSTSINGANDTIMTDTLDITQEILDKGEIIEVQAFLRARCKSILSTNPITIKFPLTCPQVVSLTRSDTSANDIRTNGGIILTGKVNHNYKEKIDTFGFLVTYDDVNGTTFKKATKIDTLYADASIVTNKNAANYNTFKAVLDMSYCTRMVNVQGFVKCKNENEFNTQGHEALNFHVRGPELDILASSNVYKEFADSITLTAKDSLYSSSQGWHSVQYFIDNAQTIWGISAQEAGYGSFTYHWKDNPAVTASTIKLAPKKDTTCYGWIELSYTFPNKPITTCKVYDSVKVTYEPFSCNDANFKIKLGDTAELKDARLSINPENAIYKTTGDSVQLTVEAFFYDTNYNTHAKVDTSVNKIIANHSYNDRIIASCTYDWHEVINKQIQKDDNHLLKSGDTYKVAPMRDTLYAAHAAITLKNDTICHVYDTVRVKYQFSCSDTMVDVEGNKYATLDLNGYCWTKSNMRTKHDSTGVALTDGETEADVHGNISNGSAKYYATSPLIPRTFEQLGLLYNHDAAKAVCPKGWHLPDTTEWQEMLHYVDTFNHSTAHAFTMIDDSVMQTTLGANLAAPGVWPWYNGSSPVHFDAYAAGARQINTLVPSSDAQMYESKELTVFWSATKSLREITPDKYYTYYMYPRSNQGPDMFVLRGDANKILGFSVRCVNNHVPEIEPVAETCPSSVTDVRDNNTYATVQIGNQCWMKENLRYNPDFPIDPTTQETPAIAYPAGSDSYVATYGLLYNYYAASVQGLCPTGWRMPTIDDFGTLLQNVENCSDVNDAKAKALADGLQWWKSEGAPVCAPGNTDAPNNASGFSARPAGWYVGQQQHSTLGENARYWAMSSNNPYLYKIQYSQVAVNFEQSTDTNDKKSYCVSIRCIKANN
jgi:uncharacterized protein (TIGR02145 family)